MYGTYPRPVYDDDLRSTLENMCRSSAMKNQEIADACHVSLRTVEVYKSHLLYFGTCRPSPLKPRGRLPKITKAAEERLLEFILESDQSPTLDEMQEMLLNEFEIETSISAISRRLKKVQFTRKRGERIHPNRDENSRQAWLSKIAEYKASQLIIVDESSTNERSLDRRWGWAPKGIAYRMKQSVARRSQAWSILPAIGINGYLYYEIYQGSFDGERFNLFIEKLLEKMTPFPGPRSVLIMDNCKTHHGGRIQEMCDKAGVILEYLPAYSPDFSPIEESFSALKAWIRRHRDFGRFWAEEGEFGTFLHHVVQAVGLTLNARGLFKACGIIVVDEDVDVDYRSLRDCTWS